jgi:hypothetical protein
MYNDEKKLFKTAGILYVILLAMIYLGSFLKFLLNNSWYGNATVIILLFIWLTILMAATVFAARGFFLIKQRNKIRQKIDFAAKLGAYIVDYRQSNNEQDLIDFYGKICKESGIENTPGLDKYYDNNNKLLENREIVYEKIKLEIEETLKSVKKN